MRRQLLELFGVDLTTGGQGIPPALTAFQYEAHDSLPSPGGNEHLEKALGKHHLELATEREFQDKFPGCEVGAMPPFGNLYNMDVYVAEKLTEDTQIAFNAGMHTELIKMDYLDFKNLVNPKVLKVAIPV